MENLEKRVSREEDLRIMEKIKNLSGKEKFAYNEGYADGILYSNKLTTEVYRNGR